MSSSTPTLQLTISPPAFGLSSSCSHCIEAELYLRVTGLPFNTQYSVYPFSTATGQCAPLPLLQWDRQFHSSSTLFTYLQQHHCNLNHHRSLLEQADIQAFQQTVRTVFERVDNYLLWMNDENYEAVMSHAYAAGVSWPVRYLLRRQAIAEAKHRHSHSTAIQSVERCQQQLIELFEMLIKKWNVRRGSSVVVNSPSVSSYHYFFSPTRPSSFDVTLTALLVYYCHVPLKVNPVIELLMEEKYRPLVQLMQRMMVTFFDQYQLPASLQQHPSFSVLSRAQVYERVNDSQTVLEPAAPQMHALVEPLLSRAAIDILKKEHVKTEEQSTEGVQLKRRRLMVTALAVVSFGVLLWMRQREKRMMASGVNGKNITTDVQHQRIQSIS